MTTQSLNSTAKHTTPIQRRPVLPLLMGMVEQWRYRLSHRKAYRTLLDQPNYLLHDLGLNRGEIEHQIDRLSSVKWK